MSDVLDAYKKEDLEWKLKITTECPLHYIKKQVAEQYEFLYCVEIPWPLLRVWSEALNKPNVKATYIDLLNATVTGGWTVIKRSCERVETLLTNKVFVVNSLYRKTLGRKRQKLDNNVDKLSIRKDETETVETLKSELEKSEEELMEWKKKYNDLEGEKEHLYQMMKDEINNKEQEVKDLTQVNEELSNYVLNLETTESLNCPGKKIHELGKKQQARKLSHLKSKAQCALWFCQSFGLELFHLRMQDEEGVLHNINYQAPSSSGGYANLTEGEKQRVEQVLYLLDKFCVGNEVYYELSMIVEGSPKSYLIKQSRMELNKTCHIERTPGHLLGAYINFKSTLSEHVRMLLDEKPELKNSTIQIKRSGDGARMSRTTNFMLMSFALLQQDEMVMSSKHNKTFAIINGPEKYETLKISLSKSFDEVNDLIEKGTLSVNGQEVQLQFFLGGDMKFLLMIMGITQQLLTMLASGVRSIRMSAGIPPSHSAIIMKFLSVGPWRKSNRCITLKITMDV